MNYRQNEQKHKSCIRDCFLPDSKRRICVQMLTCLSSSSNGQEISDELTMLNGHFDLICWLIHGEMISSDVNSNQCSTCKMSTHVTTDPVVMKHSSFLVLINIWNIWINCWWIRKTSFLSQLNVCIEIYSIHKQRCMKQKRKEFSFPFIEARAKAMILFGKNVLIYTPISENISFYFQSHTICRWTLQHAETRNSFLWNSFWLFHLRRL